MEDLAGSLMSHSHSAPLYLLYDVAGFAKHGALPPRPFHDDDGFEFATTTAAKNGGGGDAALRACASDVSAAVADELFRAGALLPLRLPPRLQRPSYSAGTSAATSPTSSSAYRPSGKHRGFDPFAAALEKVSRDGGAAAAAAAAAAPRRARSLSPLHGAAFDHEKVLVKSSSDDAAAQKASAVAAARPARRARRGMKQLLCRAAMASAAAAPRALLPRRKGKDGVPYRAGLLVCFGF
ncbi:hypothetical protein ACP4OV_021059 [Aristida adscensionis]